MERTLALIFGMLLGIAVIFTGAAVLTDAWNWFIADSAFNVAGLLHPKYKDFFSLLLFGVALKANYFHIGTLKEQEKNQSDAPFTDVLFQFITRMLVFGFTWVVLYVYHVFLT